MPREQAPGTVFVPPDVCEAALDGSSGDEACAGRITDRLHRFAAHDENVRPVGTDMLDAAFEEREARCSRT